MRRLFPLFVLLLCLLAGRADSFSVAFPGPGLGAARVVTLTPTANNNNATTLSSVSFTAVPIGAAAADRVVIVAVWARTSVGTGGAITGLTANASGGTCNGVTAMTSLVTDPGNTTNGVRLGIFGLLCTTGTTADIGVTTSGNNNRIGISVYSLTGTGGSTTIRAQAAGTEGTANPIVTTAALSIPAGGAAVGISATTGASSTGTWTVMATTDVNADITGNRWTAAHSSNASASNTTVQVTYAVATDIKDLVVASW